MKHNGPILKLLAVLVFLVVVPAVYSQTAQQPPGTPEQQQSGAGDDPIRQLNLTPEQREQIRSIREHNKDERAAIGERLRESNRALEEALNSENPDETVVDQRIQDVVAAQSAAMRMRILTEIRIRRVLTPEQRTILHTLQKQAKDQRRERLMDNAEERQRLRQERRAVQNQNQNQRNGLGPLLPRLNLQRRQRP